MSSTSDQSLQTTARALVAPGMGILAADESNATMSKRLEAVGVESTEDSRRRWRELMCSTPGAEEHISGVILYDETIRQQSSDGRSFPDFLRGREMVPGIKVDTGAKPLAGADGEKVTEGLDGLRERLEEYHDLGARFAKWRAVIAVDDALPSPYCIHVNAHALARYAALCQEAGIVPIVEPEVLMDGDHTIDRAEEATEATLLAVFGELSDQRVSLEGMILKPNMVLSGTDSKDQAGVDEVAQRTLELFRRVVPAEVPGIAFLSGGQTDELASAHLSAMNALGGVPWELSFSYGRALQATPLEIWGGKEAKEISAQEAFAHRARCNGEARHGRYNEELEQAVVA